MEFEVRNKKITANYTYINEDICVQGNYAKTVDNDTVEGINGSCYHFENEEVGVLIGTFSSRQGDTGLVYSLSEMSRENTQKVLSAIDDIEPRIINED